MHSFEYRENTSKLLTPTIVKMLNNIYEHKGRLSFFLETYQDKLSSLINIAKYESTKSSNRIEGISTTDKRIRELMESKTEPVSNNEKEITGYINVLSTIQMSYDSINLTPNIILQLHKALYSFLGVGGKYKTSDNIIAEEDSNGNQRVRFTPVKAFETEEAMIQLCSKFNEAWNDNSVEKLLLIPMFILDFLCIHPFDDDNGRMSRLLTLLLLYKVGFIVGKYISLEMIIENTKETYYEVLKECSIGWHDNTSSYDSFVRYYLGLLIKASNEFESRIEYISLSNVTKKDRVKLIIKDTVGKISKNEIISKAVDISTKTVERALNELVKNGNIEKIGSSSATCYVWVKD